MSAVVSVFNGILAICQPWMGERLLGRRPLERVHLQQPSDKVDEGVIRTVVHPLFQGGLLGHQDMDLQFLVTCLTFLLFLLLGNFAVAM